MIVTIVGAGNMARGIATRALAGGHEVRLRDRSVERAGNLVADLSAAGPIQATGDDLDGDVVVLALPYPVGRQVIADRATELSGKVVVDICNPVDVSTFDSLVTPPDVSAAEEIAAANPRARVVKAFNTTFAATLLSGQVDGQPLDVFVAGDDADAKAAVAELIRSGGMRPIDAGALLRARELEGFQLLHMTLQNRLGFNWSSTIKILT